VDILVRVFKVHGVTGNLRADRYARPMRRLRRRSTAEAGARRSTVAPEARAEEPGRRSRATVAALVAALLPILVATVRASRGGWLPVSDNAFFRIRAQDVLTEHHPLLGTWASVSLAVGDPLNNAGPLHFDLLAAPVKAIDGGGGVAVGAALINCSAVIGIALFAHRRGGPVLATLAMAVTAALAWSMGSQLLFDPWQPHNLLLPFLWFLVLVWSLTCGDSAALPWSAAVGSLLLQTHLSYALLVPALAAWGVVGLVIAVRRARLGHDTDATSWPAVRRRALRSAAAAVLVIALSWAQPVVEQFTSDGTGNLSRLVESSDVDRPTYGYAFGTQVVATVVSLPPGWVRPSFGNAWLESQGVPTDRVDLPGLGLALASLGLVAAVLAACAVAARRGNDGDALRALATGAFLAAVALVTAGKAPESVVGFAPHQFRWLWPTAAFLSFAVLASLARRVAGAAGPGRTRTVAGAFLLAAVVLSVLNLPASQGLGPVGDEYAFAAVRELEHEMAGLRGEGPFLVDDLHRRRFADPFGTAILASLQHLGIPFVVSDPGMVRQLGPSRRFTGANAEAELLLRHGDQIEDVPPGSRRVAASEGLSPDEGRELARLKRELADHLLRTGLHLTPSGRRALAAGDLPVLAQQRKGGLIDPGQLMATRELAVMGDRDLLRVEPPWVGRLDRYVELQTRWDRETVALFLRPLGPDGQSPDPPP
jgi:hypothetical protein